MSLIWLLPTAVGLVAATALIVAARDAARRAERLRVSLSRLTELRAPARRLGEDVRTLGVSLDELRRRA